jgi:16S rRNA processing protein RimM
MLVCVGQILGAHGVRGLVKLASFTADPAAIAAYGALTDDGGARRFDVSLSGANKGHWIARIGGVDGREAAQALSGTRLFVDREQLPATDDEDEFYQADLIGLRAETPDGVTLGAVAALHNFGAGDIIEIALAGGGRPMLPFDRATVPVIDLAGGRIVIDPPAGLSGEDDSVRTGHLRDGAA